MFFSRMLGCIATRRRKRILTLEIDALSDHRLNDLDPRTFGFRKLSDLVRQTEAFELDHPEGRALRIRAKSQQQRRHR